MVSESESESDNTHRTRALLPFLFYGFSVDEGVGFDRVQLIGRERKEKCFGFPSIRVTLPSRYLLTAELGCNLDTDGCRGVIQAHEHERTNVGVQNMEKIIMC